MQTLLALALAVRLCGACGGGGDWAWRGAAFYAILGCILLRPRASAAVAGPMIQWALAVHAVLTASMASHRIWCVLCAASAALAVALWAVWRPADPRSAARSAAEFVPIFLLAAAAAAPSGRPAREAGRLLEVVVYEERGCPHCEAFSRTLDEALRRRPGLAVRRLRASEHPFVRAVPTVIVRGPGGRDLFEGAPPREAFEAALLRAEGGGP